MNRKFIALLTFVLAWLWWLTNSYAYYVFTSPSTPQTIEQFKKLAHIVFRIGLLPSQPQRYENIAQSFYSWLVDPQVGPSYPIVYDNLQNAQRLMPRGANGLLLEFSPDDRVFRLQSSIFNLSGVVGNHGEDRERILRFFTEAVQHIPENLWVAGLPLSTDIAPVIPIIRGENIRLARVYRNGREEGIVVRNEQQDGPFIEVHGAHVGVGYPFGQAFESFPVFPAQGSIIRVVSRTDNLTSLTSCGPFPSARTLRAAGPDQHALSEEGVCQSEKVTLDEFKRRHLRHQGSVALLSILL